MWRQEESGETETEEEDEEEVEEDVDIRNKRKGTKEVDFKECISGWMWCCLPEAGDTFPKEKKWYKGTETQTEMDR